MRSYRVLAAGLLPVVLLSLGASQRAKAFDLLDFFSEDPFTGNIFRDATGSGWDLNVSFTNTSGSPIKVFSVGPGPVVDPIAVGFADVEPANTAAVRAALETASPGFAAYATANFAGIDPPDKTWVTYNFDSVASTPFTVAPGGTLDANLFLKNTSGGSAFTTSVGGSITPSQANAVGEAVFAYDIRFTIVPEPATGVMAALAMLGFCGRRRVA